ncbi:flagellar motor component MotA [Bradyrhizobium sp. LB1.3]
MDIMTGAGLVAGIIVVATMVLLGGDLHMFISEHAMIIIFGGSAAATMIRFPLSVLMHGLPLGMKFAFTMSRLSAHDLVDELARIAEIARKQGPVGLEKVARPTSLSSPRAFATSPTGTTSISFGIIWNATATIS